MDARPRARIQTPDHRHDPCTIDDERRSTMKTDDHPSLVSGVVLRGSAMVIGAGIAGSTAARILHDHGHRVTLLDKGRGPGGRLSSRRGEDVRHDHGCQVLRLRGESLRKFQKNWEEDGVIARWSPRILEHGRVTPAPADPWFVGMPAMNGLVRHLQTDLDVRFGGRVARLERIGSGWRAFDESNNVLEEAQRVIVAAPAPQTAVLLGRAGVNCEMIDAVRFDPTWTLMLTDVHHDFDDSDTPEAPGFDVAVDPLPGIRWMANEDSRPGRVRRGAWTVHATPDWTRDRLESEPAAIETQLRRMASEVLGVSVDRPGTVHRWRYGLVASPLGSDTFHDPSTGLLACGDWCLGGRVEHAIQSGTAAAEHLIRDSSFISVKDLNPTLPTSFESTEE